MNSLWSLLHHFKKFEFFSENSLSTRQRYRYNNIVFKSFLFGDRFQQLSFSVKVQSSLFFIVFVLMQSEKVKKSFQIKRVR